VVGGGFAGLAAARALAGEAVDLTLLDRSNHHVFQPLLYQVATGGLSAPQVAAPIRHVLARQRNCTVLLADVSGLDHGARCVLSACGAIPFDFLVLATGATHAYFGHDEWAPHAPGLKTLEDAFEIRRRILTAFEEAEREPDPERRRAWLTFAIVGAGPTGVELAGALAEIARHTLAREFRRIDPRTAHVVLLEAGDRVLPSFPPALSERARRQLAALGVEVRTGARVTAVDPEGAALPGTRLTARTVLWAAGVSASPLGRALGVPLDRAGRVVVEPTLEVPGRPGILVAGDLAAVTQAGRSVPGVAPAATQMGRHAATNILRLARGLPPRPFRYADRGTLATLGRRAAVALIGSIRLWGWPAWLAWLLVHIYFLIGFRNRLVVLLDWAWAYLTFQRHARLILDPARTPSPRASG
jgi:NADH dehydrogenase